MPSLTSAAAAATLLTLGFTAAEAHGFVTVPRMRGALNTQRNIPNAVMDPSAPVDYCAHCNNCGGVGSVMKGGPWKMFAPFDYKREGITLCGDALGNDDHTRGGKFANPPSMPSVGDYKPGSVVNFEYDFTTNHNGFLSFFLCDVSSTGDVVNSVEFFNAHCYELERAANAECESGTTKECGPIDPKHPGRWVVPCNKGTAGGDQIFGGESGTMAYKVPDVEIADGVIVTYWLTQNSCSTPDGFMQDYKYPGAWAGCPGDGGSIGGKPDFMDCVSVGRTPEEFFSCSDVTVTGSASGKPMGPRRLSGPVDKPIKSGQTGKADKVDRAGAAAPTAMAEETKPADAPAPTSAPKDFERVEAPAPTSGLKEPQSVKEYPYGSYSSGESYGKSLKNFDVAAAAQCIFDCVKGHSLDVSTLTKCLKECVKL